MSANRRDRGVMSNRFGVKSRRRSRQWCTLEPLESRVVLSYTFSLTGQTATVTPVASTGGPILIDEVMISGNPFLEWSQDNGATFSVDWDSSTPGDQTLPATTASTIDLTPTTGAGSSITLGDLPSPASNIFATFHLGVVGTPANNSVTIDDRTSTQAAGTYDFYSTLGTITGPGGATGGINFTSFGPVNSYLVEGGPADNTFDIHSTFNATTTSNTIVGGAGNNTVNVLGDTSPGIGTPLTINLGGGTNIVNVGNGNTGATISSTVQVTDPATLNIDDTADTTHSTATLDFSGNPAAPFQVTGLGGAIQYGTGVTALNVSGGTFGATGVTYDVDNTQAGTTTTINGGPNANTYNLSNSGEAGGLDNLPGPVVVNGGGAGDAIIADDSDNVANYNYTVTDTTVTDTGLFGGLTYGGLGTGGALNLNASQGSNVIDVDDTADNVDTSVSSEAGVDTVNVNGTGTGATLLIATGDSTSDPATVNVLADNEPVNISSFASFPTITTVNIGSTGGPGTMAGIQGPISVVNAPSFTSLNFHDENDTTGQTWTLDNDDSTPTGTVAVTGSATTTYDPVDLSDMTVNGGSGGNTFIVDNTSGFYPTTLNTGTGDDTTTVFATGDDTLNIQGQDGTDTVTLGSSLVAPLGMQGLTGTINVDNTLGSTDLVLDDSQDPVGQTALFFNDGTNGQVTGLSPATINYTDSGTDSLTVAGGSGGNTFTIDGTLANPAVVPTVTDITTGTGDDTTFVEATSAGSQLNIHGQAGQDAVIISFFGSVADILGPVFVDNEFGFTDLTVDSSADLISHTFTLSSTALTSTLTGLAPADITYTTLDLSSLTINTSDFGTQVMNIDMSGGNPIPYVDTPGLTWNASPDGGGGFDTHALNIFGTLPTGPFASETHNANDQSVFPQVGQYGSIFFDDGQGTFSSLTSLWYTGLSPITDTTPATNYTFNDFGYPDQSFSATTGPIVGGFQTLEFASTPTPPFPTNFETTDIANKSFVTFNTPPSIPPIPNNGVIGTVNIPIPSDGLLSLTFNTPTGGTDTVSFVNTPPGVVTSYFDGSGNAITDVTGLGVADGTVLFLNGGAGFNTLDYDAGGEVPTITPGLLPGEVLITIPGAGIVDAINYEAINIFDLGPLVITPGPAVTINTVEGFQNVDSIVGTFTAPILPIPGPPGFPAGDFTASIDWGDPSPDPDAGTITQDASDPSVYYITGTHTFLENGTYTVANTVAFAGGTYTAPVNGVPITITFGPAGPTPGTDATASVTQGPLAVSVFPIVGTEGIAIPAGPIATFIDAGGVDAIGSYSASISIFDSAGTLAVGPLPATSITQNGNAAQFTVNAPTFSLPEEGTYQVVVSVTDSGGTTPITVSGASSAVIADAPLTSGAAVLQTGNTGITLVGIGVGSFTDANPGAITSDFTGTIDWGDGSPNSVAIFAGVGGGVFDVSGSHTYAKPGVYTVTTNVFDVGGSTTTLIGSFTITDLPVTGSTKSFTAVEGQNTGPFVLATFEDPNTLATVADVSATLAIGGWGDGTPTVAGVGLTVQQTGFDPANGDPIFEVLGSHTYTEETPPGLPNTLSVIITTLGGATTTLTSPPGGGVTVLDAALTSLNGTTISGVEGSPTTTVIIGAFSDANPFATSADFLPLPGGNGGSVVVNWGDGSAPQTLTAANISAVGSPVGVVFSINAPHTYAEEGTYPVVITVTDDGGATTIVSSTAVIADAALTAGPPVAISETTGVPFTNVVVGDFIDANTVRRRATSRPSFSGATERPPAWAPSSPPPPPATSTSRAATSMPLPASTPSRSW